MKNVIRTRKELLLAKIAGESVDIATMTPPVPISEEEQLMLDIADRINGTSAAATTSKAGMVKQSENVPEAAGSAPTAAEFKALLDALIAAGIMAAPAGDG